MVGTHRHERGRKTICNAVLWQPDHLRRMGGDHVQRQHQVRIGVEARSIAQQHRPLQQVAIAIGPPAVADVVVAGKHAYTRVVQCAQRRERMVARRVAHDRHACGSQRLTHLQRPRQWHLAQRISVTDRHPALQARRARARSDPQQLRQPGLARLVQMDVQAHAIALGQPEQQRKLAVGIPVQRARVDATQYFHACGDRLLQYRRRTRARHHPRLRERHQLDAHDVGTAQRRLAHGVQMLQAGTAIDVDVATHRHRTESAALADQRLGTVRHRCSGSNRGLFHCQALAQAVHRLMRMPAVADEALVQMDMAVDQARQDSEAGQVDAFGSLRCGIVAIDADKTAITDVEIQRGTVAIDAAVDELQGHLDLPESQHWRHPARRSVHRPTKYLHAMHSPAR
ncbi:hypothetical protein D3C75_145640 [compost metagenome]